ncbi:hypothetical protein K2173_010630 [Erythroxylum novogranatense]|uniref:Phytocyanin domain-containing protein n=1 Tax=Erythroxylum novogranatense TaxID=1862640 RepID=A0AAV8TG49_9ROSI|nr:hypothetical protein K2173_010630 [Erythroxylum novogranatense]
MAETKTFKCGYSPLTIFTTISLCFSTCVTSKIFTVGGEEEWDMGTNYGKWSSQYNFSVGDVLVFKYLIGQHNVYEVTESTYRSCNASTGVLAKYESGEDEVELKQARKYWFICSIQGHCLGGMRFVLNVGGSNSTITHAAATSPANYSPFLAVDQRWRFFAFLVEIGFLFKLCG